MEIGVMSRALAEACSRRKPCARCQADHAFLRRCSRPRYFRQTLKIRAVDLFAGCGGMTLGLLEAARLVGCRIDVLLAIDSDPAVCAIYKSNFPDSGTVAADIVTFFDGAIGSPVTNRERVVANYLREIDVLVGGPPCQGHSDLNNHTRRSDPKNLLYLSMARAAEVISPKAVVIENVATVHLDSGGVVQETVRLLTEKGYNVGTKILDLRRVGVPQHRRRFLLVATKRLAMTPARLLDKLANRMDEHAPRTVGWAIRDLMSVSGEAAYDRPSRVTSDNEERMAVLFERNLYDLPNAFRPSCHREKTHSYVSVYGRLRWAHPAQTITTGFGCMGQGRYVHPERRRTITPHEAARLQTFPDWFDFGEHSARGVLAKAIGNAVPPLLMREVGRELFPEILNGTKERKA